MTRNPQLDAHGALRHLLSIEGLPRDVLVNILDTARPFVSVTEREVKKVPVLRGNLVNVSGRCVVRGVWAMAEADSTVSDFAYVSEASLPPSEGEATASPLVPLRTLM